MASRASRLVSSLLAVACGLATTTTSRYEAVARGTVFEARSWLSADLTSRLRADAASLLADGAFRSSGLSNTARGEQGDQGFGANDRSVLAITPELGGDVSARAELQLLIDELRTELGAQLQRPGLVCAEQYYSVSGAGASLPLHMDERHEEAKGARGWAGSPYRRSLSWLVYLSEPGWDEPGWDAPGGAGGGGALRAYVRGATCGATCGAHAQNLQVGWREVHAGGGDGGGDGVDGVAVEPVEPVFLDCFLRTPHPGLPQAELHEGQRPRWLSLAALYRVAEDGGREYISRPIDASVCSWVSTDQLPAELWSAMPVEEQRRFSHVEATGIPAEAPPAVRAGAAAGRSEGDRREIGGRSAGRSAGAAAGDPVGGPAGGTAGATAARPHIREVQISPRGGTLVVFDSVSVPHAVLETVAGLRWAMAGWFHEPSQEFPPWFWELTSAKDAATLSAEEVATDS